MSIVSNILGKKGKNEDLTGSTTQIINDSTKYKSDLPSSASSSSSSSSDETISDSSLKMSHSKVYSHDDELIKKQLLKRKHIYKQFTLVIVSMALLIDGMLNMVIIPIVPEFLKFIRTENLPVNLLDYFSSSKTDNSSLTANTTNTSDYRHSNGDKFNYNRDDVLIGFLFATKPLTQLIINPFSGSLIDRIGYDFPMILGLCIGCVSTFIFAYTNTFTLLFVARALQGIGSALSDTSGFAMIAHFFKDHLERSRALGIVITSLALGSFLSVPFSGVLFEYAGKRVPFIVLAFLALFDAVLFMFGWQVACSNPGLRDERLVETTRKKTPIWTLLADPYIFLCALAIVMANIPLAFTEPTIAIWMKETMHSTESEIGFIWLCGFLPHIIGVYVTVQLIRRYAKHQYLFLIFGLVLMASSCAWIPHINNYFVLIIPICIITFGYGLVDSTVLPTVSDLFV